MTYVMSRESGRKETKLESLFSLIFKAQTGKFTLWGGGFGIDLSHDWR